MYQPSGRKWRLNHNKIQKYLFNYKANTDFRHCGVRAQQRRGKRQGKTREKSEQKENNRGTEGEPPTSSLEIDALIGDEEQKEKRKISNDKKGTGRYPDTQPYPDTLRFNP